ncbi:MAG: peptidoglycan editing factor PgeF [Selenomonadaceae bacterium]|nr:peptidoglycan editing factor PgeF [Selenomonadaceae bacterium]
MSYFLRRNEQNLFHGKFSIFPEDLFFHAISTRLGGVSESPFDGLNLALHVGDDSEKVLSNRKKFIQSLGYNLEDIVTPNQVHGEKIFRVEEIHRGRGSKNYSDSISETDALITNVPNLPLMLCFADCVPIFFADTENLAVGIAHGGWKGTMEKIAAKTFLAMKENFGTSAKNCIVGIGPSIGSCCYEVGREVLEECRKSFPNNFSEIVTERDGKNFLNLWAANKIQLLEVGLPEENIDVAEECTCCKSSWYFSYRAAKKNNFKDTGRIAATIGIRS